MVENCQIDDSMNSLDDDDDDWEDVDEEEKIDQCAVVLPASFTGRHSPCRIPPFGSKGGVS